MAKYLIFKDGAFNSDRMVDNFSINSSKSSLYPVYDGSVAPISDLQEWYLTQYLLFIGMANGKIMGISTSYLARSGSVYDDFAGGTTYFPIKRLFNVTKIEFDIKLVAKKSSSPYNIGSVKIAHVNSNNQFVVDGSQSISEPSTSDFQHIEANLSGGEIDYIGIEWNDGIPNINNLYITGEVEGESPSGGAGSGYIGNSLLSNKKMVGYNVPTSSATDTKTESINEASASPVSEKPKIGNGYARIKLLREPIYKTIEQLAKNADFNSYCKNSSTNLSGIAMPNSLSDLSQYYGTDWNLRAHGNTSSWMTYSNKVFKNANDVSHPRTCLIIPLKNTYHVKKVTMSAKVGVKTTGYDGIEFWLGYSNGSTITFYDPSSYFMVAKKPVSNGADTNHKLFEISGDSEDFNAVTWEYDSLIRNVNYVYIYLADTYVEMKDLTLFLIEA